jgi:hypothetical protein
LPLCGLLSFRFFPLPRLSGAENRFDHGHVFDCVLQRNGDCDGSADGLGEDVALNRILVAGGEFFRDDAAAEQIAAVVDEDAAGTVVGGVEGDFDFDAAARAQEVAALVGHELRAASESRLAGGKIEDGRGQAVDLHFGVFFYQPKYARRLFVEDEARGVDGVTADIHERTAAAFRDVADVRRIVVEITEEADGGAQIADAAGGNQFAGAQPLGIGANHEGLAYFHSGAVANG